MNLSFYLQTRETYPHHTLTARMSWSGMKAELPLALYIPQRLNWTRSPRVVSYAASVQEELKKIRSGVTGQVTPMLVKAMYLARQKEPKIIQLLEAFLEAGLSSAHRSTLNHLQDFLELQAIGDVTLNRFSVHHQADFRTFLESFGETAAAARELQHLTAFMTEATLLHTGCYFAQV
jgi:hypothetical protein